MFYASVIPFLLAVAGFIALQTGPAREAVTRFIEDLVAENTGAVCRIEELNGNLLSRFQIRGLEIKDASSGILLLSAEKMEVSYSIPMLLRRVVWVNQLTIDGAVVNLLQTENGAWNIEMLSPPSSMQDDAAPEPATSQTDAFRVNIRHLAIQKTDIIITRQTDTGETIRNFTGIEYRGRLKTGKEISAKISRLAVQLDNPQVGLTDLSGDIRYDFAQSRLNFKTVRVQGQKSDFTVNGEIKFSDAESGEDALEEFFMDLGADITTLSLGEFGQVFSFQMPDSDIVSGDISVKGLFSKMDCRADLRMDDLHVKSQGFVAIDEAFNVGLDISGKISGLDLAALPALDLDFLPGRLNADFSLFWQQIGMPEQSGKIFLDLQSSELRDYHIEKAIIDTRIDGSDFIFKNLDFKTPYATFSGTGEVAGFMASGTDNRIQLDADIKDLNPEKLLQNSQYTGSVNGTLSVSIFIPKTFAQEDIVVEVASRVMPSQLMGMDIMSAVLDGALQNGKITLARFNAQTPFGAAEAKGSASINEQTCDATFSAMISEIEDVKPYVAPYLSGLTAEVQLTGRISVQADINGKWQKPDIRAVINGEQIVFNDVAIGSLDADGQWQGDFKDFRGTAECGAKNIFRNNLKISEMNLTTTVTPAFIDADINLAGDPGEAVAITGKINHWQEPEKEVLIDKISFISFDQPPLVNREPVTLSIFPDQIQIASLHLDSGEASLLFKGTADIAPPSIVSADLILADFNLDRIAGFWTGAEAIDGRLSADIALSGSLGAPVIAMTAVVKSAAFGKWPNPNMSTDMSMDTTMDIFGNFTYENEQVAVSGSGSYQERKFLDVNGSAAMHVSLYPFEFALAPGGLDLDVDMDQMDISRISEILDHPEYDISGIMDATASVSGEFFQPDVRGRLSLADGALNLKKQGLVYENVKGNLRFDKETISITGFEIQSKKNGALVLSGELTHDNFKPRGFDLRAKGGRLYVPFHSGVDARIDPDLRLAGTWEAPVVSGKIKVTEGRVNLERFLEKKFSDIEIIAPKAAENGVLKIPEKEPEPLAFVDPLAADVEVSIPNDFWFRGKDEAIEIKGNVQLKKDPYKPFVLYGSVLPVRGTYRFQGKLFQITDGKLTFTGQEDINPIVNVQAETRISDVIIIIRLTGTFEQINLILDSEPPMDQAAIISYLIFGRGPDDLSEKESFQAGEAALSYTGQIAADKLRDIVGDSLGIDYLSISTGSGGLRQGSLTMGKYVLPRVFVTFRQGFDETVSRKLEVTYEINKYFDLETQLDNEQTSAVDLIWKYDF